MTKYFIVGAYGGDLTNHDKSVNDWFTQWIFDNGDLDAYLKERLSAAKTYTKNKSFAWYNITVFKLNNQQLELVEEFVNREPLKQVVELNIKAKDAPKLEKKTKTVNLANFFQGDMPQPVNPHPWAPVAGGLAGMAVDLEP